MGVNVDKLKIRFLEVKLKGTWGQLNPFTVLKMDIIYIIQILSGNCLIMFEKFVAVLLLHWHVPVPQSFLVKINSNSY